MANTLKLKAERLIRRLRVRRCKVPFVILFQERSGSSHLCSLLSSHADVLCRVEDFALKNIEYLDSPDQVTQVLRSGRQEFVRLLKRFKNTKLSPTESDAVQHLYDVYSCRYRACGFKFKHQIQFDMFPEIVRELRAIGKQLHVIVLHRRNVLKLAISRANLNRVRDITNGACNFDSRHRHISLALVHSPMQIDVKRLVSTARDLLLQQKDFASDVARNFPGSKIPMLEIDYQDLHSHQMETMQNVFDFLKVPRKLVCSAIQKVTLDELSMAIANYEELESAVMGTELEQYL